jgi:hypothetical protein
VRDLGVDAGLRGVAVKNDVVLSDGEHLTGGDADLPLDEVDAGDHFRHRMLHLEPGVHFHEEELVRGVVRNEELHRAGAGVVDAAGGLARGLADLRTDGLAVGQRFQQR